MSEDLRTTTISFPHPVRIGENTFTSVTMREPMVEDEIAVATDTVTGTNQENEARLIARLCDLPADGVLKMRSTQYRVLQGPLLVFVSTPWTESAKTPSSLRDSPAGGDKKSGK